MEAPKRPAIILDYLVVALKEIRNLPECIDRDQARAWHCKKQNKCISACIEENRKQKFLVG